MISMNTLQSTPASPQDQVKQTSLDSSYYLQSTPQTATGDSITSPANPAPSLPTPSPGLPPPRQQTTPLPISPATSVFNNGSPWTGVPSGAAARHPQPNRTPMGTASDGKMADLPRGHDYEELHNDRYMTAVGNNNSSHSCDSSDFLCDNRRKPLYRRRENPVYQSTYDESTMGKPRKVSVCTRTNWILAIVALFAITSFLLVLLVVIGVISVTGSTSSELQASLSRVQDMEESYARLLKKYEELEMNLTNVYSQSANISTRVASTSKRFDSLLNNASELLSSVTQLNDKYNQTDKVVGEIRQTVLIEKENVERLNNITAHYGVRLNQADNQLTSMGIQLASHDRSIVVLNNETAHYHAELQTVIALPDEVSNLDTKLSQQVQGVRNSQTDLQNKFQALSTDLTAKVDRIANSTVLSQCEYKRYTSGGSGLSSSTMWLPQTLQDHNDKVITGVACSMEGWDQSKLISEMKREWNTNQYHCVCTAAVQSAGATRYCIMHVWTCPRKRP